MTPLSRPKTFIDVGNMRLNIVALTRSTDLPDRQAFLRKIFRFARPPNHFDNPPRPASL
jgi:hypothetical protein